MSRPELSVALILFLLVPLGASERGVVSNQERAEEAGWLQSVGIPVPQGGWPLEKPFEPPWSRRSLVVPLAWYRAQPPRNLRADLLREDLRLLRRIMENTYGGWQSAENRGWNWSKFFGDWDALLASRADAELPLAEAVAPWKELMVFQLDNHSGPEAGVFVEAGGGMSWSAVLAEAPAAGCTETRDRKGSVRPIDARDPAQAPKRSQDSRGQPIYYIVTPDIKGPMEAVHCGDRWIPAVPAWFPDRAERRRNISALAQTEDDAPAFRSISPKIAYLRLPTFSKRNVDRIVELEGKVASAGEELLIVDLRSNTGGDARIRALDRWVKIPRTEARTRMSASCLYAPLRWGYMQASSKDLRPPFSDWTRGALREWFDPMLKESPAGCPAKVEEHAGNWGYLRHKYPSPTKGKTRVLALVDNFCGSDCEMAVQSIAAVPGSVVAGVNTWGIAQFARPGYTVLPNTRMVFRIALGYIDHYGDGRSFDGYGFDVDILLPRQEDMSPAGILALAARLLR